jgi:hypothetical protein
LLRQPAPPETQIDSCDIDFQNDGNRNARNNPQVLIQGGYTSSRKAAQHLQQHKAVDKSQKTTVFLKSKRELKILVLEENNLLKLLLELVASVASIDEAGAMNFGMSEIVLREKIDQVSGTRRESYSSEGEVVLVKVKLKHLKFKLGRTFASRSNG